MVLGVSCLNKLDAATKETKWFSNPQSLCSALTALGMLQPRALWLLNRLVPLVLASNYYLYSGYEGTGKAISVREQVLAI